MASDFYQRFYQLGVQATCPECARTLPLRDFRKWWGGKRLLRTLCGTCEPEKSLEELTQEQRQRALDNERAYATPTRVANLNEAEADATRRRRSAGAKRRHREVRMQAWTPMLHVLRTELDWCRKGKLAKNPSPERLVFFEAYEAALNAALHLAKARRASASSTTQVPHPKEFMFPETRASLARLYAACAASRGRRLARDPVFLDWLNEDMVSSLKGEK